MLTVGPRWRSRTWPRVQENTGPNAPERSRRMPEGSAGARIFVVIFFYTSEQVNVSHKENSELTSTAEQPACVTLS